MSLPPQSFPAALALAASRVQARLDTALADRADEPVIHAMRYAVDELEHNRQGARGFMLDALRAAGI